MTVYEMEGFLRGKCLPGDMKVNESNAQYLVRKFSEFESNLSESKREFRAADATIHNLELKLTDMAVQLANAESKCRELAAENTGLKAAFDKPQAYLSWHAIPPTWEDPLPCGEYLDVHDETGHKNSDGTDCWPVFAKPAMETPATDAFLAEVLAQGVEMFVSHMDHPHRPYEFTHGYMDRHAIEFAAKLRQEAEL
ncbi:hNH endonuclease [Citrobacter freundii]|uniref:hNH endonuclease n=1 Tax=Citrobacter freundii TaxID=546 RepID=UPI00397A66CE